MDTYEIMWVRKVTFIVFSICFLMTSLKGEVIMF